MLFDRDVVVYDSTQIFEYLEDTYPAPALWPQDRAEKVTARRLEMEADELLFPHVITLIQNFRDMEGEPAQAARTELAAVYDHFELELADKEYLAGQFTYADISLVCAHYFAAFMGTDLLPRHTRLSVWRRRIAQRQTSSRVLGALGRFLTDNGLSAPDFDST